MRYIYLKSLVLFAITCLSLTGGAQDFKYFFSNYPRFLNASNDTIPAPFAGGINSPQVSRIDLNNDGTKDLFLFDRIGNKVMTFIKTGSNGQEKYIYAPQYEHFFPKLEHWAMLVDYNGDGKEDIFSVSVKAGNPAMAVYKNTSGNGPKLSFAKVRDPLLCLPDTIWQPGWTDTIYNYRQVANFFMNIPVITDVDDDGDIDIMSFGAGVEVNVSYYMNFSQQLGLPKDSMKFKLVDKEWAYFAEGSSYDTIFLNVPTFFPKNYTVLNKQKHTTGSGLLLLDMDGDGDKDMLHSNGTYSKINYLKNGRKDYQSKYDSMVRYDTIFPANTVRAKIPFFAAAYHVDVDNDGKRDLIVASNDNQLGKETNNVMYYKNTAQDNSPVFVFQQNDLLAKDILDLGGTTAPVAWDFDGDGDDDLFIAATGDATIQGAFANRIYLYENVNNSNYPVFRLKDADWLSLSAEKINGLHPGFGDINGDNKPDLLMGTYNGKIRYYRNTTTGSTPAFTLMDTSYQGINVGDYSTPQVIDLDRDGLKDLVIGEAAGNINYYRNTGSSSSPAFTLVDDTLGNIILNEFSFAFEPPQYEITGYSAPFFCDLDRDGKYELLAGNERGQVKLYTNIEGNLSGTFDEDSSFINYIGTDSFGRYNFGRNAKPCIAHLDGDTIPDILIGNGRGGITLLASLKGIRGTIGIKPIQKVQLIEAYPNPANTQVVLNTYNPGKPLDITMINLLGQEVYRAPFKSADSKITLDISQHPQGIYFIQTRSGDMTGQAVKLVIQR